MGGAEEGVADGESLLEEGYSLSGGYVLLLLLFGPNGTCDVITATAAAGVATAVNTVVATSSLASTFRLLNATNSTAVNLHTIVIARIGIMLIQHPQKIQGTHHMRLMLPVRAASMTQGAQVRFRSLGDLATTVLELANVVHDGNDYGRILMKASSADGAIG